MKPFDVDQRAAEENITAKGCRTKQPDEDELENSAINTRTISHRPLFSALLSLYLNIFLFAFSCSRDEVHFSVGVFSS